MCSILFSSREIKELDFVNENAQETKNIIGSVRYTSYFNHNGDPSSRRDDLLSLGYMFLFLLEDYLIWDTTNITFPQTNYEITSIYHPKNEYIKNKKTLSTLKSFCNNKMISYFNHIYNLKTTSEGSVSPASSSFSEPKPNCK